MHRVNTLNRLPYYTDEEGFVWVNEEDIIDYLCNGDGPFYMEHFMGETYLNLHNAGNKFTLFHTLVAVHTAYENIADKENKSKKEERFEELVFPYIAQLVKLGIEETFGNQTPIDKMLITLGIDKLDAPSRINI